MLKPLDQIPDALAYHRDLASRRPPLPSYIENRVRSALGQASIFDIETGDLHPSTPIYEAGIQHGIHDPTFQHAFARPTTPSGFDPGYIGGFTQRKLEERFKAPLPDVLESLSRTGMSQQEIATGSLSRLSGRDIWVQNLRHEREFLQARLGLTGGTAAESFGKWAASANLETASSSLFPTNLGIKNAVTEARLHQSTKIGVDTYLSKWENVFGAYKEALEGPRIKGSTRIFEMMDLTKSVFAMAQRRGFMPKTGELFAGTSINALSEAMYGMAEAHTALKDDVLQGEMIRHLYGAGLMMSREQELPSQYKEFFRKIGQSIPAAKQRGLVKNIASTFRDIERFKASQQAGTPDWGLLEGARIKQDARLQSVPIDVLQPDLTYKQEVHTVLGRAKVHPSNREFYTTDIDRLVQAWEGQAKARHGVVPDYQAALAEAKKSYINPYQSRLEELGGNIRQALVDTEPTFESLAQKIDKKVVESIHAAPTPTPLRSQASSFIKRNWGVGLMVGGAILAGGWLFSGKDDEYNTIQGLRHQGFAGESRRRVTDFGSGWNALRGLVRANETFTEMIRSREFQSALREGAFVSILGSGKLGTAAKMESRFRGQVFNFARKEGKIAKREAELTRKVEHSVAPNIYREGEGFLDMEYFEGAMLADLPPEHLQAIGLGNIISAVDKIHHAGVVHTDLHFKNLMVVKGYKGKPTIGVLDFGHPLASSTDISSHAFKVAKTGTSTEKKIVPIPFEEAFELDIDRVRRLFGRYSDPAKRKQLEAGLAKFERRRFGEAVATTRPWETTGSLDVVRDASSSIMIGQDINISNMLKKVHNPPIQGLSHGENLIGHSGSFQSKTILDRGFSTDFGSGYQGLSPEDHYNLSVYGVEGLNRKYGGTSTAMIDVKDYFVEDADTVRLMLDGGREQVLRLSGIDAPEVQHEEEYARNRVFQEQPYGQEATSKLRQLLSEQNSLRAIIDPDSRTYGRSPAVLIGSEGTNINLELVRQGSAAWLPFGKTSSRLVGSSDFKKAEEQAFAQQAGMWMEDSWRRIKEIQEGLKRRITHATFTDPVDLFENFRASSMVLRMRDDDYNLSSMTAVGGKDDHNIIEGLGHNWAQSNRSLNTDFSSGYQIPKNVIETMKLSTKTRRVLQEGQKAANSYARIAIKDTRKLMIGHHRG